MLTRNGAIYLPSVTFKIIDVVCYCGTNCCIIAGFLHTLAVPGQAMSHGRDGLDGPAYPEPEN